MLFCWFVILDAKVQNNLGVKGVKELKGVKGHYFFSIYLFTFSLFHLYYVSLCAKRIKD